ncbi:hypothetical protein JTB14_021043 [Gonioctena quinquepunctata]|nr:hypothetical protein JTB14_021043 [Gonioctena quinquepunctata]
MLRSDVQCVSQPWRTRQRLLKIVNIPLKVKPKTKKSASSSVGIKLPLCYLHNYKGLTPPIEEVDPGTNTTFDGTIISPLLKKSFSTQDESNTRNTFSWHAPDEHQRPYDFSSSYDDFPMPIQECEEENSDESKYLIPEKFSVDVSTSKDDPESEYVGSLSLEDCPPTNEGGSGDDTGNENQSESMEGLMSEVQADNQLYRYRGENAVFLSSANPTRLNDDFPFRLPEIPKHKKRSLTTNSTESPTPNDRGKRKARPRSPRKTPRLTAETNKATENQQPAITNPSSNYSFPAYPFISQEDLVARANATRGWKYPRLMRDSSDESSHPNPGYNVVDSNVTTKSTSKNTTKTFERFNSEEAHGRKNRALDEDSFRNVCDADPPGYETPPIRIQYMLDNDPPQILVHHGEQEESLPSTTEKSSMREASVSNVAESQQELAQDTASLQNITLVSLAKTDKGLQSLL